MGGSNRPKLFQARLRGACCEEGEEGLFMSLEREVILKELGNMAEDDMRKVYQWPDLRRMMSKKTDSFAEMVFVFLWEKLFRFIVHSMEEERRVAESRGQKREMGALDRPYFRDRLSRDTYLVLSNSEIQDLIREADKRNVLTPRVFAVQGEIATISMKLKTGEVYEDFVLFLSSPEVRKRIKPFCPEIDSLYLAVAEKMEESLRLWKALLWSIEMMCSRSSFQEPARALHRRFSEEREKLEGRVVGKWAPPVCDREFLDICEILSKLRGAWFFESIWGQAEEGEETREKEMEDKELMEEWVKFVNKKVKRWRKLVVMVCGGEFPLTFICNYFGRTIERIRREQTRVRMQEQEEASLREIMEKKWEEEKRAVREVIEAEIELFNGIVESRYGGEEREMIVKRFFDAIWVICSVLDCFALQKMGREFGIAPLSPLEDFCALWGGEEHAVKELFGEGGEGNNEGPRVVQAVESYQLLVAKLSNMGKVIQGYPTLFYHVFVSNNLRLILSNYPNFLELSHRIDNRQSEELPDGVPELLSALRIVANSIMEHPVYQKIGRGGGEGGKGVGRLEMGELLEFLSQGVMVGMSILKDKVGLEGRGGGGESLAEALNTASEEKQTIAVVKSLLLWGSFMLNVANGEVQISAVVGEEEGGGKEGIVIAPEELAALPSKLLLTSGVGDQERDDDLDGELPENISQLEDRLPYVRRFTWLFDEVYALGAVVRDLCLYGHPSYQENQLEVGCTILTGELTEVREKHKRELGEWKRVFQQFREDNPVLSFLSRSQLVSCLMAVRRGDIALLFSIFQSIGCDPEKMRARLAEKVRGRKEGGGGELFAFIGGCIAEFFDVIALETPLFMEEREGEKGGGNQTHRLKNLTSLVTVIHIPVVEVEEVFCGAHIALHHRLPSPIELLFCTSRTSAVDISDFLDRWKMYLNVRRESFSFSFSSSSSSYSSSFPMVSFWLISIENLTYQTQVHLTQELQTLPSSPPPSHPPLFLISSAQEHTNDPQKKKKKEITHVSSVLLRQHLNPPLSLSDCSNYRQWISPIAEKYSNIFVVHSPFCGGGKTESAIRHLVSDKIKMRDEERTLVRHCQISVDKTPMDEHLRRLAQACPPDVEDEIVLHFNIGHLVDPREVNLFLFQYLLVGSWRDRLGFTHPRRRQDTVVVELANTGERDERDRVTICKYFAQLPLLSGVSPWRSVAHQTSSKILYSFTLEGEFVLGAKMIAAIFGTLIGGREAREGMGSKKELEARDIPDDDQLLAILHALASDKRCPEGHFCSSVPESDPGSSLSSFVQCVQCDLILPDDLPIPPSSRLLYLRRFFLITAKQLQMFFQAFKIWDIDQDLQALAYFFSLLILRNAQTLAKPTMRHFDKRNPQQDKDRLEGREKFEDWRETPFFIVTESNYTVVSTSGEKPFEFLVNKFGEGMEKGLGKLLLEYEDESPPVNREVLQSLCNQLTPPLEFSFLGGFGCGGGENSLERLMEITGAFGGPSVLFKAMSLVKGRPGPELLSVVREMDKWDRKERGEQSSLELAIQFLERWRRGRGREGNGVLGEDVDCMEFLMVCEEVLLDIFGNGETKPPYCLTADNILRLISVQIRLNTKIPVCIIGETGCGLFLVLFFKN